MLEKIMDWFKGKKKIVPSSSVNETLISAEARALLGSIQDQAYTWIVDEAVHIAHTQKRTLVTRNDIWEANIRLCAKMTARGHSGETKLRATVNRLKKNQQQVPPEFEKFIQDHIEDLLA